MDGRNLEKLRKISSFGFTVRIAKVYIQGSESF
jgi:hypothetical protein